MMKVARLQDRIPAVAELHRFIQCTRRWGGTADEAGGETSQLDILSLTPLSVAGEVDCNPEFRIGLLQKITASSC